MSIFLLPSDNRVRVALDEDPENVITIRGRMDIGTRNKVQGASVKLGDDGKTVELDVGAGTMALLEFNLLAWEGPKFTLPTGKLAPLTPQYIRALDPSDPLVEKVLAELNERNKDAKSPDPKSPDTSGSTSAGATS